MSDDATQPVQPIAPVQLKVSGRTLALIAGGGLVAGALIVLGAIMPAEFKVDPLGVGRLTGISRLWAPDENQWTSGAGVDPAHSSTTPIARTTIDIPLGAADWPEASLEYKFAMTPGQTFLYTWQALNSDGSPVTEPVEFEFHGHTLAADGEEMTVAEYRKARATTDTGSLTAPFEGIHGWYFKNHAPDPITIRLVAEGFYSLVPPGEPGNEFRIRPKDAAPGTSEQ
jgi:hypothetical protein